MAFLKAKAKSPLTEPVNPAPKFATSRKSTPIRLFAAERPETTDAMIPGGVYAMVAETPAARFALLGSSLGGTVAAHTAATLVVSSDPKKFLRTLSKTGFSDTDKAMDAGHLQVFALQDNFNKKMFRYGVEAFVKELNHFELADHSYLIIDQADHPRSLSDISLALEQAEALAEWAQVRNITILLVFSRQAAMPGSLATLTGALENLAGIVRLSRRQDMPEESFDVTFEYWQSPDSTIAAKTYVIDLQGEGHYTVKAVATRALMALAGNSAADALQAEELEPEEPKGLMRYLYIDSALEVLSRQVTGLWQACDSVVGVIRAALGARAPTVLLTFGRQTVLRDLANTVHTLRLALGRRARLVVVERDAVLRYHNEILLLRLGTSLVVHRGVQEGRIPLMLASLQGHVFNNSIDIDFDAALASVVTSSKRGYLPPADFLRETLGILDRSDVLKLPCALVVARADARQPCTALLAQLNIARAGDLSTTDGENCFIFFSGCPESSVARALQGVLEGFDASGAPRGSGAGKPALFTALTPVVDAASLRARLGTLAHDCRGKNFPDTIALERPDSVAASVPAVPVVAPVQRPVAGTVTQVHAPRQVARRKLDEPTASTGAGQPRAGGQ